MGGRHGYVTPAANPWNTLIAKTIHIDDFEETGINNVKMAMNIVVAPKTIFVPYFSAKDPPTTCNTM